MCRTRKKIVRGIYDIPEDAGTIRVKITDLLAESLEMEVEITYGKKYKRRLFRILAFYEQRYGNITAKIEAKIRSRYNDLTKNSLHIMIATKIVMRSCENHSLKPWRCMFYQGIYGQRSYVSNV